MATTINVDADAFRSVTGGAEMAHHVREIARLQHEKKVANQEWNEQIKEHQAILEELAQVKSNGAAGK